MHILWLVSVVVSSMMAPAPQATAIRLVNGRWFDGTTFQTRTLYAANSLFADAPPAGATVTDLDLEGRYIIPPFADAHCHNFDGSYNVAQRLGSISRTAFFTPRC